MQPFKPADIEPASWQHTIEAALEDMKRRPEHYASIGLDSEAALVGTFMDERRRMMVQPGSPAGLWMNDQYTVQVYDDGGDWWHLSIKRNDRSPLRDWRALQQIKNRIIGPEHDALELFPAESRKVDTANQYHLFVLKDRAKRIPVGFTRRWVSDEQIGQARQRSGSEESR